MKLVNIWKELYSKVFPMYALVSLIIIFVQLTSTSINLRGDRLALSLLVAYVSVTFWYYAVNKYLNNNLLPRYIKNIRSNGKIQIIVSLIEVSLFTLLVGIAAGFIFSYINFPFLLMITAITTGFLAVVLPILYFLEKLYYKRINQKLEEYKRQHGEPIIEYSSQSRIEILREFADYSTDEKYLRNIKYEYTLGEKEKYKNIIKKYKLDEVTSGKKDVDLILALAKWASDIFGGGENRGYPLKRDANSIIKHTKKNNGHINVHLRCILLAEILRAYGIKAYHVLCNCFEEPCHRYVAVVHAYSENLNKWIMIEPFLYICPKDKNNNFISIPEFRNMIINSEEILINNDAKTFNENGVTYPIDTHIERISQYMFRFSRAEKNYYGSDIGFKNNTERHLIPEKYLKYTENFNGDKKQSLVLLERDFWDL